MSLDNGLVKPYYSNITLLTIDNIGFRIRKQNPAFYCHDSNHLKRNSSRVSGKSVENYERRFDNVASCRTKFYWLTKANECVYGVPLFLTLTLGGEGSPFRTKDIRKAWSLIPAFRKRWQNVYGDSPFFIVAELHESGYVHFHALAYVPNPEQLMRDERRTRFIANIWRYGFIQLGDKHGKPIRDSSAYCAKYLGKGFELIDYGFRAFRYWGNIRRFSRMTMPNRISEFEDSHVIQNESITYFNTCVEDLIVPDRDDISLNSITKFTFK